MIVTDPLWLDEHRYLTVWAGQVIEVDVRTLHPIVGPTDELLKASTFDISDFVKQALAADEDDK